MRRAPCLLRPRAALLALALVACLAHSAAGAGVFELQILEFSNYRLQLRSGACCGGARGACALPCRTRFALCLKEYQSVATPGACSFGRAASPVLGTDSFTLTDPLYTLALNFTFRWTRSFTLILQAYDDFNYTDPEETGLIEEAWWSGIVEPGAAWHALQHSGAAAAVAYRVRVTCQPNHYNSTCTAFCRPRDDKFGHYACSPHGDKRCLPGWQGDNCETPVCKEGCHPTHGRCDKPGDCDCRPGWRGELCAQCQPYPGCKHGYCNGSSWDCTCDTNWGGILCDQDLNYCGTHEPCQHGGTCENTAPDQYLCTCAEGFSGTDCERVDNPCAPQPCAHGACALATSPPGFTCACARGWAGALCDQDVDDCASAPCLHHATCRDRLDAFVCECAPGWTGPTCAEDVDECSAPGATEGAVGPCVNAAACNNTAGGYSCACLPGWTGRDCDVNVDDCTGQCLNGATCIDLVDDFHCACAPGFAGRTCARDIDDCASRPCRNGGECVDRVDAYRCICPVGFSGTDCEDDRDHCAGAPCANGAPCYTAQSDYYCHCAPGWTGKNCTQRQSARDVGAVTGSRGACGGCGAGRCVHAPPAAPHCLCDPGYAGPLCELRVGESAASAGCPEGGCGEGGACAGGGCRCRAGWTGASCDQEVDECAVNPCQNNSTCVDGAGDFLCVCADGWTGKTCSIRASEPCAGGCAAGGVCVRGAGGWRCACRAGRGGARCELPAADACGSAPCRNGGRCVAGAGWWACECAPGWAGPDCARAACDPPCPAPAVCAAGRCICPAAAATDPRSAAHCLELLAGVGVGEAAITAGREGAEAGARCDNGTWWWGCNACWCARGAPVCTRLWCGLPDCLAPNAMPCRTDEVCVPMAPALCLRGPCAALGECRRVWGRRVEPAPLPAPAACVPGARAPAPRGCARARLQLLRERLSAGAHVERACHALRRALAAALLARALPQAPLPPLALLCDLATDDDDALDLAIWVGEEEGADSSTDAATLGLAVRALSELVAHRRLAAHALLGAALRLRVPHDSRAAGAGAAGSAGAHDSGPAPALLALGVGVPLLLAAAAAAALLLRRRRAAAERERRDEEKSNNLQNEENLRRYANPLREDSHAPHAAPAAELPELPRAHALYKACNADARNNTPPARDKDTSKRALPPAPPERLTVLV